jgi:outer membrane protein
MKRKFLKYLFIPIFILFSVSWVQSQKVWTLVECVQYALEHNLTVKQQKINIDYAGNTYTQSKVAILPNLNGGASGSTSSGYSVDPFTYDYTEENVKSANFSINSSVTLFAGFQKMNTIAANKYNLHAALADYEKLKNDISINVSTAYLQILFAEEILAVAEKQLEITDLQVKQTKKLVDAGSLAKGSLLEVQAQQASDELQLVNAENQLNLAFLTMTQLLELGTADDFRIARPNLEELDESILAQPVLSIYNEAITRLPQVKSAEYNLLSAKKNLAVAKGSHSPRLSISGSYYTGYSNNRMKYLFTEKVVPPQLIGYTDSEVPQQVYTYESYGFDQTEQEYSFKDQFKDNAYKSLSINLSIPIFNNLNTYYGVENSKLNVMNNELMLDQTKNLLYKEIQQAHADAVAALKKFDASEKSLSAMEESFRYTNQKFDVGLVNIVDFNVAKSQLAQTESEQLKAKYEFLFKTSILEFYRGKTVNL